MTIIVMLRSNAGQEGTAEFHDVAAAVVGAKTYRNPGNYLVAFEVAGEGQHRWGRDPVVCGNRWRKVAVNCFEVLGAVREIRQR